MKTLDTALPRTPFAELAETVQAPRSRAARAAAVIDRVFLWQERIAERHRMRGMTDHELKDIGLSRADIEQEAGKPFWRA